jgi:aminoglycoside/choline kinase family phosphotransferase
MLPLPIRLEDVSAGWLTAALALRYPGVEVRRATQSEVLQGTATKARMTLEYNEAGRRAGLPATLFVKGGFSAHREMMAYVYELEVRFYRDIAPRLDVRVPRCYFAGSDPDNKQHIVLLEDLDARGATFCRVQRPLDYAQAAAQLEAQACCHARWWNSADFAPGGELAWAKALDPLPEGEDGIYQRGQLRPEVYAHYMALPRGAAVSLYFHDRDRMERAMERLRVIDRQGLPCLLHGDAHLGNMYFDADGAAGMVDWQTVGKGPWAHDVAYFLGSALDVLDRREWERPLLRHYLEQLRARGVSPPSFEEAWESYCCQMVYGLYYWLVNPVAFQAEVNNCAVASRFALAALDLGTFDHLLREGHH